MSNFTSIKVYNQLRDGSQGKPLKFVVNLYHTSSKIVVNGNRVDLFVSDFYRDICTNLSTHCEDLSIVNRGILQTIDCIDSQPISPSGKSNISNSSRISTLASIEDQNTSTCSTPMDHTLSVLPPDNVNKLNEQISIEITYICPICNLTSGNDTIECGNCLEWIHFTCSNIPDMNTMDDKDFICMIR